MPATAPGPETPVYSPSEINREVRTHLEAGFPRLWLRGEISNLARPASGHLYFSLKDARAQIRCALFRGNSAGLGFRPANGDEVLVRGRLSLYEPRGDYQLIADGLLAAGAGALQQAFEALKKKLEGEGLFAPERKQALPAWPRRIAVVTSPSGAAVRDILDVLARRWPLARVRVYASPVQGDAAAPGLRRALLAADRDGFADVVLLARGGGSIEDLWAFNDEALARTIAALETPLISGVGHETDFTIADFVADVRAPTPTAAAVAATPDGLELKRRVQVLSGQVATTMQRRIDGLAQGLDHLDRRLQSRHPRRHIEELARRLDVARLQVERATSRVINTRLQHLNGLDRRLAAAAPARTIARLEQQRMSLNGRLRRAVDQQLERAQARLGTAGRALNAASPLNILERGYAVVRATDGTALTRPDQFQPGREVGLLFRDFEVRASVLDKPESL
ncbi:exodeoxyribonuclease VII large subunit [Wenzhouxiangella limi]|uniref:Exodeoxyribonuclease 7 large subunit n=1 Tax=Wenzhouxiangella limi TaxID=2707351 RepID=A0A845UVH8_9GAMM|nr:exodeoxyribonuclease VII large subunit [Wenzhouxiangella limi]NDY94544.1 exodeoxyribonuclease VII large subunit [Wenzhouxiangella limi]